jgi:hypothetical protein
MNSLSMWHGSCTQPLRVMPFVGAVVIFEFQVLDMTTTGFHPRA